MTKLDETTVRQCLHANYARGLSYDAVHADGYAMSLDEAIAQILNQG